MRLAGAFFVLYNGKMRLNLMILVFLGAFQAFASSQLVSETVGSMQSEVLTARGMIVSFVLENILNKKTGHLPNSKSEKIQAVNTYLLDHMVNLEAQGLGFKDVNRQELDTLVAQAEKFVQDPSLKIYKIQKIEIQQVAERKLIVKNFLKSKSESFVSLLSEQDLQDYYAKNRLRFGTVAFAEIKESIRAFLMQQQRDERLKAWIEVLKRKYKARNYLIENQGKSGAATP